MDDDHDEQSKDNYLTVVIMPSPWPSDSTIHKKRMPDADIVPIHKRNSEYMYMIIMLGLVSNFSSSYNQRHFDFFLIHNTRLKRPTALPSLESSATSFKRFLHQCAPPLLLFSLIMVLTWRR
ncbi:unnamed protein product [Amoebophrya sp. A25]|nr:unnamed protein product [Amoebophrya sp. A25]|eukprot:GSA25T00012106001.1